MRVIFENLQNRRKYLTKQKINRHVYNTAVEIKMPRMANLNFNPEWDR